jgi:hypothetical protein
MTWESQFARATRALRKIERPRRRNGPNLDDLYSFFQNCWHLKDWIKNDDSIPADVRAAILHEAEIIESLRFCADLANRSKHHKLTRERVGAGLWHVRSMAIIDAETGEVTSEVPIGFTVVSKIGSPTPSDIVGFASRAVQEWTNLLVKHGLMVRKPEVRRK